MYDPHLVYHGAFTPFSSAPPHLGPLHPSSYMPIPTQQYGCTQPYIRPSMYNSHHQPNFYGRNNHERLISHHYGINYSLIMVHGTTGSAGYGYQPSDVNHNAMFMSAQGNFPSYNGAYNNYHHGQHGSNFHSSREPVMNRYTKTGMGTLNSLPIN